MRRSPHTTTVLIKLIAELKPYLKDVNEDVNVYVNDNVLRQKKEESFISLYPKENYATEADRYEAMFRDISKKWEKRRQEKCRGA